jgi:hypothetical protein
MILHSKRTIFIHVPRTAGTSVTQFLKEYFNALDVPENLEIYKKDLLSKGYSSAGIKKIINSEKIKEQIMNYKFSKHATAKYYLDLYGEEVFKSYFKFSIIRNPWERMVSWYIHGTEKPFKEKAFIEWLPLKKNDNQIKFIEIDGKIAVDKLCRYENLKKDLTEVFKKLSIPDEQVNNLPVLYKTDRKPYKKYYNDSSKKLVGEMFSEEIKKFGYSF